MKDMILQAYQAERASPLGGSGKPGKAPELTPNDHAVALLASSYSENDLRQAAAMRGAYERQRRRDGLAEQKKAEKATAK